MAIIDVNDFTQETECIYDGERYSVRDNGAVLRHHRIEKRVRRSDNQWTFGKVNSSNGYLYLSNVRIHRIVATVFHGEPPNSQYVVDHIDTNRQNNRPENLRWVTRLENALLNPVTRKKIELICGSIDAFLKNPSILNAYQDQKDLSWMRTVTPEEAQNCKERMSLWANSDKKPRGGALGEWIYEPIKKREIFNDVPASTVATAINAFVFRVGQQVTHPQFGDGVILQQKVWENRPCLQIKFVSVGVKMVIASYVNPVIGGVSGKEPGLDIALTSRANTDKNPKGISSGESAYAPNIESVVFGRVPELVMALTKMCAQYKWRVPSYFPCCPEEIGTNPLEAYFLNLKVGTVFSYNDSYPKSTILEVTRINDNSSILVMCEKEGLKPWSIAEITFEGDFFVHTNLGSYFDKNGADKAFCIKQGLEWTGGDTFNDFC